MFLGLHGGVHGTFFVGLYKEPLEMIPLMSNLTESFSDQVMDVFYTTQNANPQRQITD